MKAIQSVKMCSRLAWILWKPRFLRRLPNQSEKATKEIGCFRVGARVFQAFGLQFVEHVHGSVRLLSQLHSVSAVQSHSGRIASEVPLLHERQSCQEVRRSL